jgi:hypothetical protein
MSTDVAVSVSRALRLIRAPRLTRRRVLIGAASVLLLAAAIAGVVLGLNRGNQFRGPAASSASAADSASFARRREAPGGGHRRAIAVAVAVEPAHRPRVAGGSPLSEALFSPHSWHIEPPPPPPAPPAPPPAPTAPPFPYTFVGAFTPEGGTTVYFLAREDRVIDAHVGDRIDGSYDFESANDSQLVFNYLPLNLRQSLPSGAKP